MYIVDITRKSKEDYESDMLFGKLTTDAKTKTLDYIIPIYITGVSVKHFDSWDKTSFTDDFVVFGVFELLDED